MKKTLSLLIISLTTTLFAANQLEPGLKGFSVTGTGAAFTTNLVNTPTFMLGNTAGSVQTFAFETDSVSTGTTVSNVIHAFDFAVTKNYWDTNTTVYVTNALAGSNTVYRLNTVTAPAHARWVRQKSVTIPAITNDITISTAFAQAQ